MICDNCVKEDVCNQKDVAIEIQRQISEIYVKGYKPSNYGISIEVSCRKAVKKQTDIFTTRSTENTKNI